MNLCDNFLYFNVKMTYTITLKTLHMINFIERIFGCCFHSWEMCEVWTKHYENEFGEEVYLPIRIKKCSKCNKTIKY